MLNDKPQYTLREAADRIEELERTLLWLFNDSHSQLTAEACNKIEGAFKRVMTKTTKPGLSEFGEKFMREHFLHAEIKCDHDFKGWHEFDGGRGGECVCTKCGAGALAHSIRERIRK